MRAGLLFIAAVAALPDWCSGPASAETIQVSIEKLAYSPFNISARVGDTIIWSNKDILVHTATSRDKSWDLTIPPNKTARLMLNKAGEIDYYCKFHPNMKGHISVKP